MGEVWNDAGLGKVARLSLGGLERGPFDLRVAGTGLSL